MNFSDLLSMLTLVFQSSSKGEMMLLATEFSSQLADQIETYLTRYNSIPAFLSSITLELFNRETQTIVINWSVYWVITVNSAELDEGQLYYQRRFVSA